MSELDPRKQSILQAVVVEYVGGAEPVGSEMLVQKYDFGVKSATVRNELAEMSELGFLEQPHTSAGRIPSDLGYRYFVDHLIVPQKLGEDTKHKVRNASEDGEALQSVLRDTSRALSRLTHLLTVASVYSDSGLSVRNAVVSALGPSQAMLVLILSNGHVVNRMVDCPPGLTLDDIGVANEHLASVAATKSLRTLARAKPPAAGSTAIDKLLGTIWTNLRSIARDLTRGTLITEGEEFMFAQPEFQRDLSALVDFLNSLTESEVIYDALNTPNIGAQTVTIGRENKSERLHRLSLVRQSFFVGKSEVGVIALIGPTRMRYDTSIPLVSFTARALTESLTRFFG